ncbi:BTAD domain-containing putative transcriptional regulator [Amycolatopsis nigrescens]|uniref:BTAD domain-containing putative transcriptional regulator n=1 Tax=Amycolatopsis nigrescens TaxID=381445 RepID=UPI00038012A6|nr:BTAD domain-containing putative transcriptional regulator [Amycolatopsis nigrescens]
MRFGVLGALAVWTRDGDPVTIPGLKVRALLADLLAHEGKTVSADRLVEDLWGDRPPGNPAGALQAKISQLRRALDEAEPSARRLVVSRAPGYLLEAGPEAVDSGRFTALLTRAGETGDPRAKAALLADALALWRGPAFADFADEEFAGPVISKLEELRLSALEEQAEARLELGEHAVLVGELGDLVARYPLRERLRATQLRALYRAGRQSEALQSYTDLRDRLRDELGLDPGPGLVALHGAILAQDPRLDATPAAPAKSRTNLPAAVTGLLGRDGAVAEVRALLERDRLVTLTGPGGVGKTRLAMETAGELVDAHPDGVWVAELAAFDRGRNLNCASVVDVVMAALGIRDETASGPLPAGRPVSRTERLSSALRSKRMLLVLDNCEHVVEPVAELAGLLLRAAPELRLLATSQEPLGLAGEVVWPVPPLALPGPGAETDPAALREFSSVQLFVTRAAAASPGFTLDEENAAAVAAICRRLDGIPLALELAATRVRALGVHELDRRLDDRFQLLAAGHRGAPARQQTLRAMIDWSWQLLTVPERVVLRRLAVHADGCTLAAAEAVCAGDGVATGDVLDLLARLVDRSLVVVVDGCGGHRYRLLESVAAYCVERLRDEDELERVRDRHNRYYLELAEQAEPQLRGRAQRKWLERLDAETANLRGALEGALRRGEPAEALRLVNALAWYWFLRGRLDEGARSLELALAGADAEPGVAEATAWRSGIGLMGQRPGPAATPVAFERIADPGRRARAEWFVGEVLLGAGDLSTSEWLVNRALARFRELDDRWGVAAALSARASQALVRGDLVALERDGERSGELFRELGDRWGQLRATNVLGSLAEITGDYEQAARLQRDGLRMAEELGLWPAVADKLAGLGRLALLAGDLGQARLLHERASRLSAEQSYKGGEIFAEVGLGLGARREGRLDDAEAHVRRGLEWNRQVHYEPGIAQALNELGFIAELRGDAETARARHLEGLETARATGDPRAIALAFEGMAGAAALSGDHRQAARLLGAAAAARNSVSAPLPPRERLDVDRITAIARKALGEELFQSEFTHGTESSP